MHVEKIKQPHVDEPFRATDTPLLTLGPFSENKVIGTSGPFAIWHMSCFSSRFPLGLKPAITGKQRFTQHIFLIREFLGESVSGFRGLEVHLK